MTVEECKFPPYPSNSIAGIMLNYRHYHNLTKKELADILGMTEERVIEIEKGKILVIGLETYMSIVLKIG